MVRARARLAAAALCVVTLSDGTSYATTLVPMTIEALRRSSVASVLATVTGVHAVESPTHGIVTLVSLDVDEIVDGTVPGSSIVIREPGGSFGGRHEVVFGTPSYEVGEQVLLFLTTHRDGSLRTNHLALGKFTVILDATGTPYAQQSFAPRTYLFPPPGSAVVPRRRALSDLLNAIRHSPNAPADASVRAPLIAPPEASDPSLPGEGSSAFTLLGGRAFEPDEGQPVSFLIDQTGDAGLGLTAARAAIDLGLSAWTQANSSVVMEDAGLTSDRELPCPGPNKILFDDPMGVIPPPVDCHGTLGISGACYSEFESKHFGGRTFNRILRSYVMYADGWSACAIWTATNFAEIAAHELGHAIGIDHSSERDLEPNALLRDAAMYFRAHFDGRGADLRADDLDAVHTLYPSPVPLTITSADPLPAALVGVSYDEQLVTNGSEPVSTWTIVNSDFPELTMTAHGVLNGVPAASGSGTVSVRAISTSGNQHTKTFSLTVTSPSPTLTNTPTRTASATLTSVPSPTATFSQPSTPSRTATGTPTSSAAPSATSTATASPTDTASVTATITTAPSPSPTTSVSPTPLPTETPSPTVTTTATATATPTSSATETPTVTATVTPSSSATATPSATTTLSATASVTATASELASPTPSVTATTTDSPSQSVTPTDTTRPTATPADSPPVTPEPSATASPSETPTISPPPTNTAQRPCAGDCDGGGQVTVDDLVKMVNVSLEMAVLTTCPAGDISGDGAITVEEIIVAVKMTLSGCTGEPAATSSAVAR